MSKIIKNGIFLNRQEREFQKKLQHPIPLSDELIRKKNEAFEMIQQKKHCQDSAADIQKIPSPKSMLFRWSIGFICALLVFIGTGILLSTTNPAFAQELPVVNEIFKLLQKNSDFWKTKDISKYAVPLDENTVADPSYTKTKDGLTLTVAEVYANPQKIYFSIKIKSEEPLTEIGYFETDSSKIMSLKCNLSYKYSFMDKDYTHTGLSDSEIGLEGVLLNDNTFEGALTLDLENDLKNYQTYLEAFRENPLSSNEILPDNFTIDLKLKQIVGMKSPSDKYFGGYTEDEYWGLSGEERDSLQPEIQKEYEKYPNPYHHLWFDGPWEFAIPLTIDQREIVRLDINEVNNTGHGITTIYKTPTLLSVGVLPELGSDWQKMVVLDANNEKLPVGPHSDLNTATFLTEGYNTSTIDIYLLGQQLYDEIYSTSLWSEFTSPPNGPKKRSSEEFRAMLTEYSLYHKTLHFETSE